MDKQAIAAAIGRSDVGPDLPPEALQSLADMAQVIKLESGEVLIDQGQPGEHIYLIVKGSIQILFAAYGEEDAHQEICRLAEGAVVGEMSMLEGELRSARSITLEPSVFLALREDAMIPYLKENSAYGFIFMRNLARILSRRLRYTNMAIKLQLFG